jgi:hypothetical protein
MEPYIRTTHLSKKEQLVKSAAGLWIDHREAVIVLVHDGEDKK